MMHGVMEFSAFAIDHPGHRVLTRMLDQLRAQGHAVGAACRDDRVIFASNMDRAQLVSAVYRAHHGAAPVAKFPPRPFIRRGSR
jgi:hypothetical protein